MTASPIVIILGMHRSGTSSLAGSLQAAGLMLGDVNTQAPFNAKGNREYLRIMHLHDRVLANSGHAWNSPPPAAARWTPADLAERDAIVEQLAAPGPWGFKDPRTLFTLEGWLERFPEAQLVGTLRHPGRVAASLAARPAPLGVEPAQGLALWAAYNRRLWAFWRRRPFPMVDFDADPVDYHRDLTRVRGLLGLAGPPDFFDEALRRSPRQAIELDQDTASLYQDLLGACRATAAGSLPGPQPR